MMHKTLLSTAVASALLPAATLAATGPSSSESPYLGAVEPGVEFTSILTVGDAVKNKTPGHKKSTYRMVGIPDGLGAYDNGDDTFSLLMNHELGATVGIPRAHGAKGAFVSTWQIRKGDLKVLNGADLITDVQLWDAALEEFVDGFGTPFNRFCSADLPLPSAFYNSNTGLGFDEGRIFMNGEETGDESRAFAHVIRGIGNTVSYELPYLGKYSWENSVASPYMQDLTIVAGLDDDELTDSQLYFYVGTKQSHGNPVDKAGLMNGKLFGVKVVAPVQTEDDKDAFDTVINDSVDTTLFNFEMVDLGYVAGKSGADIESEGMGAGVSNFRRVEDGAWDLNNPNVFFFVTTANFSTASRLWKVTFADIESPTLGGTIELLLNGGDGVQTVRMMDNLTLDGNGDLIIQEDPGGNSYLAKIWKYSTVTGTLTLLAEHDIERFDDNHSPASPSLANESYGIDYFVQDEESSGVIEITDLLAGSSPYDTANNRFYLGVVQAHRAFNPDWTTADKTELVEGGQLLLMKVAK